MSSGILERYSVYFIYLLFIFIIFFLSHYYYYYYQIIDIVQIIEYTISTAYIYTIYVDDPWTEHVSGKI